MAICEETPDPKVTWEVKALKETEGSLGLQVSLGSWANQVQKDQRDKKAMWESPASRGPWAREGVKAPWDLVVNQGHLGLERKGTEVSRGFRVHLVSRVLWGPKVPAVLLAHRVLQVCKGSEVKWDSLVSKVTKDLWDHQDPKVTRVRKDPEASQASQAQKVCLVLWASLELKEQWDLLARMDSKAHEVNKVSQGCLGPEAHQDLLETQESQVSPDPKDLRDFLAPPADQGLKVNQELQAGS